MMEKTLILKHISGMLCLLISYSKFTRPTFRGLLTGSFFYNKINSKKALKGKEKWENQRNRWKKNGNAIRGS